MLHASGDENQYPADYETDIRILTKDIEEKANLTVFLFFLVYSLFVLRQ